MTLEDRSSAVARAGARRELGRLAAAAVGILVAGVGFAVSSPALAAFGGILLGVAIGQMALNPERLFMEGFSDGLIAAPELDARLGAAPARGRAGPPADVRRLPGGPPPDDPGAAGGAGGFDRGDAPDPVDRGLDPRTIAAVVGVDAGPGLPRPASDAVAIDARALSQGPGRSRFPAIPAAHVARSPVRVERPTPGVKARRRQRPLDQR